MRKIALGLLLSSFLLSAQAFVSDDERYLYLRPLLGQLDIELFGAVYLIDKKEVTDPEILDVLAEVLAKNIDKADSKLFAQFDAIQRMMRSLGKSGLGRYRPFLIGLENRIVSERSKSHLRIALQQLPQASDAVFEPGKLDLNVARAAVERLYLKGRKPASDDFTIPSESTIADVFSKFGYPHAITVGVGWKQVYGIDLIYFNRGAIRMRNTRPGLNTYVVMRELPHPPIDDGQPSAILAHRLMIDGTRLFLGGAEYVSTLPAPDRTILDAAADRVWLSLDASDDDSSHAVRFLCLTFKKANDPRYRPVLVDVVERSKLHSRTKGVCGEIVKHFGDRKADEYLRREITATK